ncbi:MAG: hypothetical protein PHY12_06630 [Eubacteriales bacterium]|nr:hypothetical protein [Eubacteriales bacterium]
MNGFTNALLSLLLGWLKSLFNAIWQVLDSDGGGSLLSFLRDNWKMLLIIVCVGGVVVDGLVYLFRWRPYYLWFSRGKKAPKPTPVREQPPEPEPDWPRRPADPFAPPPEEPSAVYAPPAAYDAPAPTAVYTPVAAYAPPPVYPQPEPIAHTPPPVFHQPENAYVALEQEPPESAAPYAQPASARPTFAPPGMSAPPPAQWEAQPAAYEALRFDDEPDAWQEPAQRFAPAYTPRRAPESYLRDVQSGFAPPPAPEELYRRPDPAAPVHPGLDRETLLENIGLLGMPAAAKPKQPKAKKEAFPTFAPFASAQSAQELEKPRGFGKLARKARTFVGGVDEDNPLSIRDLQSTVDMRTAFHAPVYPKKKSESEDE